MSTDTTTHLVNPNLLLDPDATVRVAQQIIDERANQDARWGQQDHPNGTYSNEASETAAVYATAATDIAAHDGTLTWDKILLEEVCEAFAEEDPIRLRAELVQVAAVTSAWIEAIDRKADHLVEAAEFAAQFTAGVSE